ncbi:MAG: peroxidase-related enzyme [Acidimicrobiales bacterium]|nr:peroxidase-related enzyme [Acidimicrobiales bacterium]
MAHHRRGLRRLLRDDGLADAVEADWRSAPISDQRRAMLEYAILLTTSPGKVTEADIDALRTAGFSDRDILDIAEVTAYYAYANRIADGLGIAAEPWIPDES